MGARANRLFYNLIMVLPLIVMLLLSMLGLGTLEALALEQEARCGYEEHAHTEDCYIGEILVCGQKAHSHSQNCYLVLLEDNDINWLLQTMSGTEEKSLEGIIDSAMVQALSLNENLHTDTDTDEVPLNEESISTLNATIQENDIQPSVVLNENLKGAATLAAPGSGSSSTFSAEDVGGNQQTGDSRINIYLYIVDEEGNGSWQCVDSSLRYTNQSSGSGWWRTYYKTITPSALTNQISILTGAPSSAYKIFYGTENSKTAASTLTVNNTTYTRFSQSSSSTSTAESIYLHQASTGNNSASNNNALKFCVITYTDTAGNTDSTLIRREGETVTLNNPGAGYVWQDQDGNRYQSGASVTLSKSLILTPIPNEFTVTYINGGDRADVNVTTGAHTVATPPAGYVWLDGSGNYYTGGERLTAPATLTATKGHVVTYLHANGTETQVFVQEGRTVTLPTLTGSYRWYDEKGNSYAGGESFGPVLSSATLKAARPLTISYDVAFSGRLNNQTGSLLSNTPTLSGTNATTATVTVNVTDETTIQTVTPSVLSAAVNHNYGFVTVGGFVGWRVTETGEVIKPSDLYSYDELLAMDTNGDGKLALTGVWESGFSHAVNFVISFKSNTSGGETQSNYTHSLYSTYVDVPDGFTLTSGKTYYGSDVQSQTAVNDATIRALQGPCTDTNIGVYNIPPDDYFFEKLKELESDDPNLSQLTIDGISIPIEDLNSKVFAIRWYITKYYSNDGWHIDGTLVRKTGNIIVTKTFDGRTGYVEQAQNGFTITARAGTMDGDIFTDNTSLQDYTLTAERAAASGDNYTRGYDSREETVDPTTDTTTVVYTWVIPKIGAGEIWQIRENLVEVEDSAEYGEWVIVDSSNEQSKDGIGTVTTVTGVTFPEDISSTEWLKANFTNVYYTKNTLLLRKVDSLTGEKLDGAKFELYQNDRLMKFRFEDGRYVYDPSGPISQVECNGAEILIDDYSYGAAPITVREVKAPSGYRVESRPVTIGYSGATDSDGNPIVSILNPAEVGDFATFSNGILIFENKAATVDVVARKEWYNCTEADWTDTVRVQLLANGSASLAADLQPGDVSTVQNLKKVSNGDGTYSYSTFTWHDLPVFAGGVAVTWSLKEIAIGDEEIKADGTFPNWNAYVGLAVPSADGKTQTITVTNMPKASTLLRIQKTDLTKTAQVAGATFTIEDQNGNILGTATTDNSGVLYFYRLKYETNYIIRETVTPPGYLSENIPIYVEIFENGTVEVQPHDFAEPGTSNFTLLVKNEAIEPLPETGGTGTYMYTQSGLLLMLLSVALYLYRTKRRGEVEPS